MYICTGYDDLVADCIFSLNDIVSKRTLPPRWVPLYGIGGLGDLAASREALPHAQLETCYKVRLTLRLNLTLTHAQLETCYKVSLTPTLA